MACAVGDKPKEVRCCASYISVALKSLNIGIGEIECSETVFHGRAVIVVKEHGGPVVVHGSKLDRGRSMVGKGVILYPKAAAPRFAGQRE